jgi:hypothetical protein
VADYPEDLDRSLTRGELALLGIAWREIHGPLWRAPYRNVHVWSATDAADPVQRAIDASALLPAEGALGGWAAARVAGVTQLDGSAPDLTPLPVLLCTPPAVRRRRGPGIRTLRSPLLDTDVVDLDGIRVTSAVRTAVDLARTAPSLSEAVVALDTLARGRPDFLDLVRGYAFDRPRWKGVPQVNRALQLATDRSRSPAESRFRMLWVLEAGLPVPLVNPQLLTADGTVLAMVDLLDEQAGLVGEYDGAGHRLARQHALDNAREESIEGHGLVVVRATGLDLSTYRMRTRTRLAAGHARARRSTGRARTWWAVPGPLPPPAPFW